MKIFLVLFFVFYSLISNSSDSFSRSQDNHPSQCKEDFSAAAAVAPTERKMATTLPSVTYPKGFPEILKTLSQANTVVLGPMGVAAHCDQNCKAYGEALKTTKSISSKDLNWILQNGTPSGKLYGAILLNRINPDEGKKAFESLLSSTEQVIFYPGGCMSLQEKLGTHAKNFLNKSPLYQ